MPIALCDRNPSVPADRLVAELVPPPRFADVSFDSYRPDRTQPSQGAAVERLRSFSTRLALATILECLAGLPTWRRQANTGFEDDYRSMLADARHHDATVEDHLGPATTLRRPAPWT